jgi:ubiquinone/menaquinone biosynthesis C-methylase UbiE
MRNRPASFDPQAETFDRRAGWPEADCQAIVCAALALAQAQPGDRILEVGAGTGMLGTWLARSPLRYVGLDLSRGMLGTFQRRLGPHRDTPLLLQADGNAPWPLAAATVRVIFSSRALHLLAPEHVVRESFRVARSDGALCLLGRVQRQADGVGAMMQREMQRLLRQHGIQARAGGRGQRGLLETYAQAGASVLDPVAVVRWTVTRTPWQSIEAWQSKPGLGGTDPPPSVKRAVLDDLSHWATETLGDLQRQVASEEAYVLQGVRLRP